MELTNKIAIVTGGSSGLGKATALKLIDQGVKVAIFDINQKAGESIVSDIGSEKAMYCHVDVRNANSVEAAVDGVIHRWGGLYICVNCAGIAPAERLLNRGGEPMALENFQNVIDILQVYLVVTLIPDSSLRAFV